MFINGLNSFFSKFPGPAEKIEGLGKVHPEIEARWPIVGSGAEFDIAWSPVVLAEFEGSCNVIMEPKFELKNIKSLLLGGHGRLLENNVYIYKDGITVFAHPDPYADTGAPNRMLCSLFYDQVCALLVIRH